MKSQEALIQQLEEGVSYLKDVIQYPLKSVVICGTGISSFIHPSDVLQEVDFEDVPHLSVPSVEGHKNKILIVQSKDENHMVFAGRLHYYEGHDLWNVTFPIRLAQGLGINKVIITNAAGGINPEWEEGDLGMVEDHLYLIPESPFRGLTSARFGNRFPEPKHLYQNTALSDLDKSRFPYLRQGIYACVPGPHLETRAELNRLRLMGADLVGMSSVPEALVACQCEMEVVMISIVTNIVDPGKPIQEVLIEDVIDVARSSLQRLRAVVDCIWESWANN